MFEWDGEELANIIWGKEGENEDHIVPYPDETYEKPSGPDLSLSNTTKQDLENTDEKAQVDNNSQSFDNQPEDDDFGWANVESFNDLDKLLSNNDLVYENTNILGDLSSHCEHFEAKTGFIKDEIGGKNEKSTSDIVTRIPSFGAVNAAMPAETGIGKMDEKGKSLGRESTKGEKWFSLGNQGKELERGYTQHMKISSSKAKYQYKQSPSVDNILRNQQFCSSEEQPSGSSCLMRLSMTPQEKIEKLKRRQQMRALLAIRKQQEEFRHLPNCLNDESLSNFMSLDASSSLEKSDSDSRRMIMNASSLEDTILHRLENVISTLDVQIRLCIRDSLFRLAQSAWHRQHSGDTVTTNEPKLVTKEISASTKSSARRRTDGETKTNPIDRAVAHLLFHRPPELHGELLQSPSSASTVVTEGSSIFEVLQG